MGTTRMLPFCVRDVFAAVRESLPGPDQEFAAAQRDFGYPRRSGLSADVAGRAALDPERLRIAVHLARIDPARNMCWFYRLDVLLDLFGGLPLVKEWGRIGAHGRMSSSRQAPIAPASARRSASSAACYFFRNA
jgi:predicted DNA-binding WGR domain protein